MPYTSTEKKRGRYVVLTFIIKLFQNGFNAKFVLNVTQWRNDITLNGQMLNFTLLVQQFAPHDTYEPKNANEILKW